MTPVPKKQRCPDVGQMVELHDLVDGVLVCRAMNGAWPD